MFLVETGKPAATESHLSSELAGYRRWGRDGYRHADAELGVRLLPGNHQVQLEYRSRRLRMVLLGLGLLTLPLIVIAEKHGEGLWRRIAPRFVGPISNSAKGSVDE